MTLDREKINAMKQEFQEKADNLTSLLHYGQKIEEQFLNVKLSFTAFIGVLFVVIFDKIDFFGKKFLVIFLVIVLSIFISLIWDFWCAMSDIEKANKNQYRRVLLAKIRHIVSLEADRKNLNHYGYEAEKLLLDKDETRQKMFNNIPIEEIIKYPKNEGKWKMYFVLWAVLFLSAPVLFLFKLFNFL